MTYQNIFRVLVLLVAALLSSPVVPQENQPPPPQSEPSPQTPATTQPPDSGQSTSGTSPAQAPAASAPGTQPEAPTQTDTEHPRLKRKPATKKKRTGAKTQQQNSQAQTQSGKVVVRNGGASDKSPEISLGMSDQQAQKQKDSTSQLLASTDANLKRVEAGQLTANQQSTLDQINTYMRQSKAALDAGDVNRAHTLAYKAHLLSDELARH